MMQECGVVPADNSCQHRCVSRLPLGVCQVKNGKVIQFLTHQAQTKTAKGGDFAQAMAAMKKNGNKIRPLRDMTPHSVWLTVDGPGGHVRGKISSMWQQVRYKVTPNRVCETRQLVVTRSNQAQSAQAAGMHKRSYPFFVNISATHW